MDERIDKIKIFLIEMNSQFKKLKFRCGYGSSNHTFIIEVKPLSEFNNNENYAKEEFLFTTQFDIDYSDYDIIFVSEEGLCKVNDVLFEIGYESPIEYKKNNQIFEFNYDDWVMEEKAGEINYALAA
ncbi:hypothetical protein [Bacteroides neonati]|uniref:hypothetical protein n=1 Tax=Bacteroides neonati TaxID=1347393 RepID=UPI0004B9F5B9|nr:hypothetical protein [Bacteroides neonati]